MRSEQSFSPGAASPSGIFPGTFHHAALFTPKTSQQKSTDRDRTTLPSGQLTHALLGIVKENLPPQLNKNIKLSRQNGDLTILFEGKPLAQREMQQVKKIVADAVASLGISKVRLERSFSQTKITKAIEKKSTLPEGVKPLKVSFYHARLKTGDAWLVEIKAYIAEGRFDAARAWSKEIGEKFGVRILLTPERFSDITAKQLKNARKPKDRLLRDPSLISPLIKKLHGSHIPASEGVLVCRPGNYIDLTHLPFVTIDPKGTRDRDDAVYGCINGGNLELFVSFTDITTVVRPGSDLYDYARDVIFSHYAEDNGYRETYPLLGEEICFDTCSILKDQERFAWTVRLVIAGKGKQRGEILGWDLNRTLIKSRMDLSYEDYDSEVRKANPEVLSSLGVLDWASKLLRKNRLGKQSRAGFADEGGSTENSNRIIEECMIAGKSAIGHWLEKRRNKGQTAFRVDSQPLRTQKKSYLGRLNRLLGLSHNKLGMRDLNDSKRFLTITDRLDDLADGDDTQIGMNGQELRRELFKAFVATARYSTHNVGHDSIGTSAYTEVKGLRNGVGMMTQFALEQEFRRMEGEIDPLPEWDAASEMRRVAQRANRKDKAYDGNNLRLLVFRRLQKVLENVGREVTATIASVEDGAASVRIKDLDIYVPAFQRQGAVFLKPEDLEDWREKKRTGSKIKLVLEGCDPGTKQFVFRPAS